MAAISKSDATAIAKEYYASGGLVNAAYEENPGMALASKKKITGKHYDFPIQYGYASNRSRTASTALAKTNKTQFVEFNVTTVASYDAKDIEKQAMAEITDSGAFVDLLANTIDNLGKALGNGVGEDLFLGLGASIGQVGAVSTTSLTLKNPSHVSRFYVGQVLRTATTDGTSGALESGSQTISAINRDTGVLTAAANWSAGIGTIAADQYIFNDGDFGLGRAGLPAWVPDVTTNLGTAFYGATRSTDATRLAGCRQSVSTGTDITSALRTLLSRMGREEAKPNIALCSYDMLADLETQLEQKNWIEIKSKSVDLGFEAIRVLAGGRRIDFVADRSCGDDRIYVGKRESLELIHSSSDVFEIDDEDGEVLARNATAFSYDIRGCSFSNYVVRTPKDWGVLLFS
jgi:hypothetical protein